MKIWLFSGFIFPGFTTCSTQLNCEKTCIIFHIFDGVDEINLVQVHRLTGNVTLFLKDLIDVYDRHMGSISDLVGGGTGNDTSMALRENSSLLCSKALGKKHRLAKQIV